MGSYLCDNNKSNCSGCQACKNICPTECITMKPDLEGFLYPEINQNLCIKCGMCVKVCPYEKSERIEINLQEVYAVKNKDRNIVAKSSSGGVFIPISDVVLDEGGIVCGAKYDDKFQVIHSIADNKEERNKFCSSKYVQSNIGRTFNMIKKHLNQNKKVLFSGTPCQVDGLKCFLGKHHDNLLTIDFVCHGVPSPLVFNTHINKLEKKYKSKINSLTFRYKQDNWGTQNLKVNFKDGRIYSRKGMKDNYYNLFLSDVILRPSCHSCKYANTNRISDITIADFWGIEKIRPKFNNKNGVSLTIVNSERGKEIFENIKTDFYIEKCNIDEAKLYQPNLSRPTKPNKNRDEFFRIFNKYGYKLACFRVVTIQKIINKPKKILNKINR